MTFELNIQTRKEFKWELDNLCDNNDISNLNLKITNSYLDCTSFTELRLTNRDIVHDSCFRSTANLDYSKGKEGSLGGHTVNKVSSTYNFSKERQKQNNSNIDTLTQDDKNRY